MEFIIKLYRYEIEEEQKTMGDEFGVTGRNSKKLREKVGRWYDGG
jgi:hypothetical protein